MESTNFTLPALRSLIVVESPSAKCKIDILPLDTEKYTVLPLVGKFPNVRLDSFDKFKISQFSNLIKTIGLNFNASYDTVEEIQTLSYRSIIIMTEPDVHGSHTLALIVNAIEFYWPNLLKHKFIWNFQFPYAFVKDMNENRKFLLSTEIEYDFWKKSSNIEHCSTKIFGNISSLTNEDVLKLFDNFEHKLYLFSPCTDNDRICMNNAFAPGKTGVRQNMILKYGSYRNTVFKTNRNITYANLVKRELVPFWIMFNLEHIPSVIDGLTNSTRPIIFTLINYEINKACEITYFAEKIREYTEYRRNIINLHNVIQTLIRVYKNIPNLQLFKGSGGTVDYNSKGTSATHYNSIEIDIELLKLIFQSVANTNMLKFEKNNKIPMWYVPNLPMLLITGCDIVGCGYKSYISSCKVVDVIKAILQKINGETINLVPNSLHQQSINVIGTNQRVQNCHSNIDILNEWFDAKLNCYSLQKTEFINLLQQQINEYTFKKNVLKVQETRRILTAIENKTPTEMLRDDVTRILNIIS